MCETGRKIEGADLGNITNPRTHRIGFRGEPQLPAFAARRSLLQALQVFFSLLGGRDAARKGHPGGGHGFKHCLL